MAKPWLKFRVQGAMWRVRLVPTGDMRLEDAEGRTLWRTHEIIVDESMPFDRRCLVAGHEIGHVFFSNTNPELVTGMFRCKATDANDAEEAVCAFVGPMIGEMMLSIKAGRS